MSDLSRSASERSIVEDDTPQPVGSMPAAEIEQSEPRRIDADTVEFSASLSDVLSPGETVRSDELIPDEDLVEYTMTPMPGGGAIATPVDEKPPKAPTDRQPEEFRSPTLPPDSGAHDRDRQDAAESVQAARQAHHDELQAKLDKLEHDLRLAEATHAADRLGDAMH